MKEMPNAPKVDRCCLEDWEKKETGCMCTESERACRSWAYWGQKEPMTAEQREWCIDTIRSLGDSTDQPDSFDGCHDSDLAKAVLCGWYDYAKDKGLA